MKLLIATLGLLFLGCAKDRDPDDTLNGDAYIYGTLSYADLYNGNGDEIVLAGRKVYISYTPTDTINYLYYDKTDAQGNFFFRRLDRNTDYALFFYDSINDIKYSAYAVIKTSNDSVRLVATNDTVRQNALHFRVTDEQSEPVASASLTIYNSQKAFEADTAGAAPLASASADIYGRTLFYNLKPGKYYVRGKAAFGNVSLRGDTVVTFSGTGIQPFTLELSERTNSKNSLTIVTRDAAGAILPKATFCVFINQDLFIAGACEQAIFSGSTNDTGTVKYEGIPAGVYYILATAQFGGDSYKGTGTVTVNAAGDHQADVNLLPVADENRVDLIISDATGTPVFGTDIYLFSSRVLFYADTTLGAIQTTRTDAMGKANFRNLDPGKYFIKAEAIYGSLKLTGSDSATVTQQSLVTLPITVK